MSDIDTYGILYKGTFNALDSNQNKIIKDDGSGDNDQFKISTYLCSTEKYVLVVTTYHPHTVGNFLIIANGPALVNISLFRLPPSK